MVERVEKFPDIKVMMSGPPPGGAARLSLSVSALLTLSFSISVYCGVVRKGQARIPALPFPTRRLSRDDFPAFKRYYESAKTPEDSSRQASVSLAITDTSFDLSRSLALPFKP